MNIFLTDDNHAICAQDLPDILLNKMITESAQILSSVHHVCSGGLPDKVYKLTHTNNKNMVWARTSTGNYLKLLDLMKHYIQERKVRYNKGHKVELEYIQYLEQVPVGVPSGDVTTPPRSFGDFNDVISKDMPLYEAYKKYLNLKYIHWMTRNDKRRIFPKWTQRNIPSWINTKTRSLLQHK